MFATDMHAPASFSVTMTRSRSSLKSMLAPQMAAPSSSIQSETLNFLSAVRRAQGRYFALLARLPVSRDVGVRSDGDANHLVNSRRRIGPPIPAGQS
jgi:hypothetical protein